VRRTLLEPKNTLLLVVDVQERFRAAISDFDVMLHACVRLVKSVRILGLPILVTEQYPRGLGQTVPELRDALSTPSEAGDTVILAKTVFSACGAPRIEEEVSPDHPRAVLVCGIETHVCVNQTVHDLLEEGHEVHVAVDAIGSRKELDREVALRTMERSGAFLTTTEAAVFELLRDARHPKFKEVQALFK
jgi:nicotinamidase-related amidase